jgi:hypothetical protein
MKDTILSIIEFLLQVLGAALIVFGACLFFGGIYQISPPAIMVGLLMLAFGILCFPLAIDIL